MTQPLGDLHRTPLIEKIVDLKPREKGTVHAGLHSLENLANGVPFSFALEVMAQAASLVSPHQRAVRLRRAEFSAATGLNQREPLTARAVRIGSEIEVHLSQLHEGQPEVKVASALVETAQAPRDAPSTGSGQEWALDRRGRADNASALYDTAELTSIGTSEANRVVQWATYRGLGQLVGGIGSRGPHFGSIAPSTPLASSPGVIDALTQLIEWQWYALAGEGCRVQGVEAIEWYRIPRAEESLVATVKCRGSASSCPVFDATAFGADHKPAIELRGVRLLPILLPVEREAVARVAWQSFVRLLDGMEQGATQ